MFSGLDIFFICDANNTKRIVEIFLSWIFFFWKLGPGIFFFGKSPPPHKKSNGRSLSIRLIKRIHAVCQMGKISLCAVW